LAFSTAKVWKLAFLGSILLWASFPPVDCWPLAWIAPVPWVLLIGRKSLDGRRPYTVLAVAGFLFWMGVLHFMRLPHWATSFGWIALSAYFAFYVPLFVGLSRVAVHRLRVPLNLAAPIVWTGLELARAHLFSGMSMACLGHTQYRWIELIQVSDLAGAHGVSFVVMFVAASLARMLPCDGRQECLPHRLTLGLWPLLSVAALLAAVLLYGHWRMATNSTIEGPRVALIQGSIDAEMRYDPERRDRIFKEYYGLSREAVEKNRDIDLIVWPETMFITPLVVFDADATRPADFEGDDAEFRRQLGEIAKQDREKTSPMATTAQSLGVPLLLGVDTNYLLADRVQLLNSAAHVAADGRLLGRYDKMHLVMFGEYVPFADKFPWLQQLTPLPLSATAGKRPVAFDVGFYPKTDRGAGVPPARAAETATPQNTLGGVRIAPSICYESVLSHVIRGQVNALAAEGREPDILVNLTNDGWFWGSSELDLHLICGVFRAVECRKPFLIAANTGFSASIDSDGRIQKQGPRRDKGIIIAEPRLDRDRRSWYLGHGDWFAGLCLVGCVWLAVVGLYGRIRHRRPLLNP
jgi:apolipoprotein N-acyltransferase